MKYVHNLIQSLRQQDIKVRILHSRYVVPKAAPGLEEDLLPVTQDNRKEYFIGTKGGQSRIELTFPDGKNYVEIVKCNKKDSFCKRLAISIGVGRIMHKRSLELPPQESVV